MNEQLLINALTAEERLAPDPSDVLAGLAGGIRRRRQRRVVGWSASALALVLVAAVIVVSVPRRGEQVAGPTAVPTGDWNRTVRFGFLPDGLGSAWYSASATGEGVLFPINGGVYLRVDISSLDWKPQLDYPGWEQVQVAGRPGRLVSRPTRTMIDWQLPSGRWASLEYGLGRPSDGNAQPTVQTDAERIAAEITEGAAVPVGVGFGLTHLPDGMRIVGVRARDGGYGVIELVSGSQKVLRTGVSTTEDGIGHDYPVLDEQVRIEVMMQPGSGEVGPGYVKIADIQSRPAYSFYEGRAIAVHKLPQGHLMVFDQLTFAAIPPPPPLPQEQLVAVAEGVRWTG